MHVQFGINKDVCTVQLGINITIFIAERKSQLVSPNMIKKYNVYIYFHSSSFIFICIKVLLYPLPVLYFNHDLFGLHIICLDSFEQGSIFIFPWCDQGISFYISFSIPRGIRWRFKTVSSFPIVGHRKTIAMNKHFSFICTLRV